jgi:hypothetical protein
MAGQVTHVAPCPWSFFDGAGLTGRGQGVIADGRGYCCLTQQNNARGENDKRTSRTFSGQLPVPTSRDFNSYLDCKNPIVVDKFGEFPQFFDLTGGGESYAIRINEVSNKTKLD